MSNLVKVVIDMDSQLIKETSNIGVEPIFIDLILKSVSGWFQFDEIPIKNIVVNRDGKLTTVYFPVELIALCGEILPHVKNILEQYRNIHATDVWMTGNYSVLTFKRKTKPVEAIAPPTPDPVIQESLVDVIEETFGRKVIEEVTPEPMAEVTEVAEAIAPTPEAPPVLELVAEPAKKSKSSKTLNKAI